MESNKYYLGDLVTQRREKNPGGNLPIRGVSKEGLQSPKQVEADTSIYNLYYRNDFVYNPARMELGSIAFNDEYDQAICSSLYEVFYVHRTDLVIPEYLALFVKHPEFARYCSFIGNGSAREYCRFDSISGIPIYLPSISEQRKIVHDNQVITNRIKLLRKMNDVLFDVMNAVYSQWFFQFGPFGGIKPLDWTDGKIEDIAEFYDYLRKPLSGEEREGMQKLYPYYGAISIVDYVEDYLFDDTYVLLSEDGANILDDKGHPALQFIHGKVWVNNHAHVLKAKNGFSDASLYIFLSNMQMKTIVTGAAQPKINQENLRSFPVVIPAQNTLEEFNRIIDPVFLRISENNDEIDKLERLQGLLSNQLAKGA